MDTAAQNPEVTESLGEMPVTIVASTAERVTDTTETPTAILRDVHIILPIRIQATGLQAIIPEIRAMQSPVLQRVRRASGKRRSLQY